MIKTTSKRQAQRERATETRTGFFFCSSQRCVCFNKFIIWTICFYFYFHLTVFWYFYLCGFYVMAKEFIIHRILYELWSWWRFYGNGDFSSVFASFFFSSSLSQHFLNHIFFCSFVVAAGFRPPTDINSWGMFEENFLKYSNASRLCPRLWRSYLAKRGKTTFFRERRKIIFFRLWVLIWSQMIVVG